MEKWDSKLCYDALDSTLLLFAEIEEEKTSILRYENFATNRSDYNRSWLYSNDVYTLLWLAKSPYLNLIEKLCVILAKEVHKMALFHSVEYLED